MRGKMGPLVRLCAETKLGQVGSFGGGEQTEGLTNLVSELTLTGQRTILDDCDCSRPRR